MESCFQEGITATPECEAELTRLQGEFVRLHDLYLRALADLDNLRKRVQRDQVRMARTGTREILLAILEVVDNFDRALEQASGLPESLTAGIQAIHRQLFGILKAAGVVPMETLGHAFDPLLHEAIATVGAPGQDSGTVVAELSRGYRWENELLRPAKVSVAARVP